MQPQGDGATPFQWKSISEPWNIKGSELQQLGENQGCTNMVAPLVNRYEDEAAATPVEGVLFVSTGECPPPVDIQVFLQRNVLGLKE